MSEGKPFVKSGQLFDWVNAYDCCDESECLFTEAMNESLNKMYKILDESK